MEKQLGFGRIIGLRLGTYTLISQVETQDWAFRKSLQLPLCVPMAPGPFPQLELKRKLSSTPT